MTEDYWDVLRRLTPARIGLRRHGAGVSTRAVLESWSAHAAARDAVHRPLDVEAHCADLRTLGLGEPDVLCSAAPDRATYLTRPDLGRRPGSAVPSRDAERVGLAVLLADGLSSRAIEEHAVPLLRVLVPLLPAGMSVSAPVVGVQARVALGDHVGAALGAELCLVLIGERPGLSASDSLGAYLTWQPRPGMADAARNCVSNIRPPQGLDYDSAARTLASLMEGARRLGGTGVRLKDLGGTTSPVVTQGVF